MNTYANHSCPGTHASALTAWESLPDAERRQLREAFDRGNGDWVRECAKYAADLARAD